VNALERFRMSKRLTRAELATAAGVSVDTVSNIEEGRTRGNDSTLFKLSDALDCQPWELREPAPVASAPTGEAAA
jgi:transcriptional regulator with XRE-family HTH domain